MKIISKHKDYYDWAVSIYGLDEIMVYDRRTDNLEKASKDPVLVTEETGWEKICEGKLPERSGVKYFI